MRKALALALFATSFSALADGSGEAKVDRADLVFLTDGRKHYIAVNPGDSEQLFYARAGEPFYKQQVWSTSQDGKDLNLSVWAPQVWEAVRKANERYTPAGGKLTRKAGRWTLECGGRTTPLTVLSAKESAVIRNKATFEPRLFRRAAYLFGRDDTGTFYYVDARQADFGGGDYRLFVGRAGAVKELRLSSVITDEVGDVFSTAQGTLVRNHRKQTISFVKSGTAIDVFVLDSDQSRASLYTTLGVYNSRLGTICDDL